MSELSELLSLLPAPPTDGEAVSINIFKEKRELYITAKFKSFVTFEAIDALCSEIMRCYNLQLAVINPVFDKSIFCAALLPEIAKYINEKYHK